MKRGDIYYVFPGDHLECGSEQRSGRPALVVSNDNCNSSSNSITVAYITGQEKTPMSTHVDIPAGLPVYGTILCEQLSTVDVHRFGNFICRFNGMANVDRALKVQLGLTDKSATVASTASPDEISYKALYQELLDKIIKGRS